MVPPMGVLPERKVRWQRWALALTVAGIAVAPAREVSAASRSVAKAPECPSAGTRVVGFARAVDGEVFVTADGEEVRLAGILPLGAGGEAASPDAASAKDALNRALRDRTVTLAPAQTPRDRYGRSLAHVFADGVWVQGALLRDGEVRAAPDLASAPCANALLGAEAEAREGRFKHWRDGRFRVRGPNDLGNREGSFQIVEGEVVTATVNRARAFTVLWRIHHKN
jgi:micrococcal nuclease